MRSSSSASERACSLARSAWAARTPNVVSRASSAASGACSGREEELEDAGGRLAERQRRRDARTPPGSRSDRTARSGPASSSACRRAPCAAARSASRLEAERAGELEAAGAGCQTSPTGAPTTFAATRTTSEAHASRRARLRAPRPRARARAGRAVSAGRASPPNARSTSAAWPPASSAANCSAGRERRTGAVELERRRSLRRTGTTSTNPRAERAATRRTAGRRIVEVGERCGLVGSGRRRVPSSSAASADGPATATVSSSWPDRHADECELGARRRAARPRPARRARRRASAARGRGDALSQSPRAPPPAGATACRSIRTTT